MAEYIKREAAQKVAERYGCTNGATLGRHSGLADCIASEIEALPPADVAPVRHGRWIDLIPKEEKRWDWDCVMQCSECKQLYADNRFKYCPNCGADMRDGGDDNG